MHGNMYKQLQFFVNVELSRKKHLRFYETEKTNVIVEQ